MGPKSARLSLTRNIKAMKHNDIAQLLVIVLLSPAILVVLVLRLINHYAKAFVEILTEYFVYGSLEKAAESGDNMEKFEEILAEFLKEKESTQ